MEVWKYVSYERIAEVRQLKCCGHMAAIDFEFSDSEEGAWNIIPDAFGVVVKNDDVIEMQAWRVGVESIRTNLATLERCSFVEGAGKILTLAEEGIQEFFVYGKNDAILLETLFDLSGVQPLQKIKLYDLAPCVSLNNYIGLYHAADLIGLDTAQYTQHLPHHDAVVLLDVASYFMNNDDAMYYDYLTRLNHEMCSGDTKDEPSLASDIDPLEELRIEVKSLKESLSKMIDEIQTLKKQIKMQENKMNLSTEPKMEKNINDLAINLELLVQSAGNKMVPYCLIHNNNKVIIKSMPISKKNKKRYQITDAQIKNAKGYGEIAQLLLRNKKQNEKIYVHLTNANDIEAFDYLRNKLKKWISLDCFEIV